MQLPQDLTTCTLQQEQDIIRFLSGLTLDELRLRQDLCRNQLAKANKIKNLAQRERAIVNLQIMDDHLMQAVDIKYFM